MKKPPTFSTVLGDGQIEQLRELAKTTRISQAKLVREALELLFEEHKREQTR